MYVVEGLLYLSVFYVHIYQRTNTNMETDVCVVEIESSWLAGLTAAGEAVLQIAQVTQEVVGAGVLNIFLLFPDTGGRRRRLGDGARE